MDELKKIIEYHTQKLKLIDSSLEAEFTKLQDIRKKARNRLTPAVFG